jgi:hypothetical protein
MHDPLSRDALVQVAAVLAAATCEKDLSIATEVARLFDCKDHYELAALEFFRYVQALENVQERIQQGDDIL